MSPAETFKACGDADREYAIMALQAELHRLDGVADSYRDTDLDVLADVIVGHMEGVRAAIALLRELHKEGAQ